MHYHYNIFTKGCPTDKQILEIMKPYNEEIYYANEELYDEYPAFTWDWYALGGRYGGIIKLDVSKKKYQFGILPRSPHNGRNFRSALLDKIKADPWEESGWLNYLGFPDGFLCVDGAYVCDILNINDIRCYGFIDTNGEAHVREWWNGNKFTPNETFSTEYEEMIEAALADPDVFMTTIDVHD